jgi:hypothetical protein
MSNHEKADHWRSIAEELGADVPAGSGPGEVPSSEEPSKKPPETPSSECWPPRSQEARRAARPPKARANWGAVAEQLGLAPTEAPPREELRTTAEPPLAPTAREIPTEPLDWLDQPRSSVGFEDVAETETAESTAAASGKSETGDEHRLRKRRKRRRHSRQPRTAEAVSETSMASEEAAAAHEAPEVALPDVAVSEGQSQSTAPTAETPRRGRRDRDRRRKPSSEPRTGRGARERIEAVESSRDSEPASAAPEDEFAEEEQEPEIESSGKEGESFHGGIPSWAEAVGIVIAANMEGRAKRGTAESSSRGRGGRGRRDRSTPKQSKPN